MEIKFTTWYPTTIGAATSRSHVHVAADRDRDPQQGGTGYGREKPAELDRPLTDEEFEAALQKLTQLQGFHSADLSYRVEKDAEGNRIVLILNSEQTVVRRLTESQLGTAFLLQHKEEKGGLIDKAA